MYNSDERMPLAEGTELQSEHFTYIIDKIRGQGGSSIVYAGNRAGDNLPVLVKELYPLHNQNAIIRNGNELIVDDTAPIKIQESAGKLFESYKEKAKSEQDFILRLAEKFYAYGDTSIDFFEQNNTVYTVFQNKDNGHALSEEPQQSLLTYLKYTKRLLEALEPLHAIGYLHMDISPDNVYKTNIDKEEPILRLIDFNATVDLKNINSSELISLKQGFTAYEVRMQKCDKIGYATDLYSVAACLFYWVKGQPPTALDSTDKNIIDQTNSIYGKYTDKAIEMINAFLYKGLQANSQNRYQSTNEMMADLKNLIKECDTPHSEALQKPAELEKEKKRAVNPKHIKKIAIALACVVAAIVVCVSIYNMPQTIKYEEDGSVYVGQVRDNQRNGYGELTYSNGDILKGYWVNGKLQGEGEYYDANNQGTYKGNFKDSIRSGYGELTYPEHEIDDIYDTPTLSYRGNWKNGLFDGEGELLFINGDMYQGEFKNGLSSGNGILRYNSTGDIFQGEFENGYLKYGMLLLSNGGSYHGEFNEGSLNGNGYCLTADGTLYEGNFTDYMLDGEIKVTLKDGSKATGIYEKELLKSDLVFKDSAGNATLVIPADEKSD